MYGKYPKGSYEYADYKKRMDFLYMIILFALPIGLFVIGYITVGSKRNVLTILAVLGLLPACKMVVSLIMSLRVKVCDEAVRKAIEEHVGDLNGFYHLYFTSYDKNFPFVHCVATNNSFICYCNDEKVNEKAFQDHLKDLLKKEGINDVTTIKIFYDFDKYLKRLDELNESQSDNLPGMTFIKLLNDVSL